MPEPILEVAVLNVVPGQNTEFEAAFRVAQDIISGMDGYVRHTLKRGVERPSEYVLLVWWESLEAHTVGFRGSPQYAEWRALLHHFYDPFPTVLHYGAVEGVPT
ncbi:antibiotic biosynthesis monooxygenase family protein [Deinococcus oregonensis]|uniref:Antibiotic biosynthesis monooxygenase family protein n=1 Tax=Deinococcus oregonensis TaxID=1805970 RepID=A0ABV6B4G9_9DEIO